MHTKVGNIRSLMCNSMREEYVIFNSINEALQRRDHVYNNAFCILGNTETIKSIQLVILKRIQALVKDLALTPQNL